MLIITIFFFLLKLAGYGLILIILSLSARDLIVFFKLKMYKKQGMMVHYIPIIGLTGLFANKKGAPDQLSKLKQIIEDYKDEPIIALNSNKQINPTLLILEETLIREFFLKEVDYTQKCQWVKNINFGFFFHDHDLALAQRTIYSKFFHHDNLSKLSVMITSIFHENCKNLKTKLNLKDFGQVDWKILLDEIMSDLVSSILFGEKETHYIDGIPLTTYIVQYIGAVFAVNTNPINMLSLDFLHNKSLLPVSRKWKRYLKKIEDAAYEIYLKRQESGPKPMPNVLDLLVEENKSRVANGLPELTRAEIGGHFILLQFGGADTSKEIIGSTIVLLGKNQHVLKKAREIVDDLFIKNNGKKILDYEDYENNPDLENFIKEWVRLGAPVPVVNPRIVIKDFQLGKYTIYKGTRINIPCGLNHINNKNFKNPNDFDFSRMSNENMKSKSKTAFMPFGLGRRNWVGKALGELIVTNIISNFVKQFDVKEDENISYNKVMHITYGYYNPIVMLRERQNN